MRTLPAGKIVRGMKIRLSGFKFRQLNRCYHKVTKVEEVTIEGVGKRVRLYTVGKYDTNSISDFRPDEEIETPNAPYPGDGCRPYDGGHPPY